MFLLNLFDILPLILYTSQGLINYEGQYNIPYHLLLDFTCLIYKIILQRDK